MAMETADVGGLPHELTSRKIIMGTRNSHPGMPSHPHRGVHDGVPRRPGGQAFPPIEGECAKGFEGGGKPLLGPGSAAPIEGGTF